MKFTIDRSRWRTGRYGSPLTAHPGIGESQLCNDNGFQCCLGFYLEACGVDRHDLEGHGSPENLEREAKEKVKPWLLDFDPESEEGVVDSPECAVLIRVNDDTKKSDREREEDVARKFAAVDVEVEFIGAYPQL